MGRRTLPPAPAGSGGRGMLEQNPCRSGTDGREGHEVGAFHDRLAAVRFVARHAVLTSFRPLRPSSGPAELPGFLLRKLAPRGQRTCVARSGAPDAVVAGTVFGLPAIRRGQRAQELAEPTPPRCGRGATRALTRDRGRASVAVRRQPDAARRSVACPARARTRVRRPCWRMPDRLRARVRTMTTCTAVRTARRAPTAGRPALPIARVELGERPREVDVSVLRGSRFARARLQARALRLVQDRGVGERRRRPSVRARGPGARSRDAGSSTTRRAHRSFKAMAKKSKQPKTPIPAALRQKLEQASSKHSVDQRNTSAPRGGHSPRAIRHQGR